MKEKIEEKILFLEAMLREIKKDCGLIEEELIYSSQIKVLKQVLEETE